MRTPFVILIALAGVAAGAGAVLAFTRIHHPSQVVAGAPASPKIPSAAEQAFIREAMGLEEHIRNGVTLPELTDQLADLRASFRFWTTGEAIDLNRKAAFDLALQRLELARDTWRMSIGGEKSIDRSYPWSDKKLNSYMDLLGEPELEEGVKTPDNIAAAEVDGTFAKIPPVSTFRLSQLALQKGIEYIDYAIQFVDLETEAKKIKALDGPSGR